MKDDCHSIDIFLDIMREAWQKEAYPQVHVMPSIKRYSGLRDDWYLSFSTDFYFLREDPNRSLNNPEVIAAGNCLLNTIENLFGLNFLDLANVHIDFNSIGKEIVHINLLFYLTQEKLDTIMGLLRIKGYKSRYVTDEALSVMFKLKAGLIDLQ